MTDEVVAVLKEAGALRFGEFELSGGGTSSYYVDVKEASMRPEHLRLLAGALAERVPGDADGIACVALGGVPLAVAVSLATDRPLVVVRKTGRDHGTGDRIVGRAEGRRLVLIEDVTTTGASAVEAVRVLREAGATVQGCLVVVDRDEGAAEALAAEDVKLTPLVGADRLLEEQP